MDNLFYDVNAATWGGTGAFALIGEGPTDIAIEHNTVSQNGNIIMAYGGTKSEPKPIAGFVFRDNLIRHNRYGVHGADRAPGQDTLQAFFPDTVFQSNVIGGGDSKQYPKGNTFITDSDFDASFVNAAAGNYRLAPGSRLRGAASDGRDVGADIAAIAQALGTRTPNDRVSRAPDPLARDPEPRRVDGPRQSRPGHHTHRFAQQQKQVGPDVRAVSGSAEQDACPGRPIVPAGEIDERRAKCSAEKIPRWIARCGAALQPVSWITLPGKYARMALVPDEEPAPLIP